MVFARTESRPEVETGTASVIAINDGDYTDPSLFRSSLRLESASRIVGPCCVAPKSSSGWSHWRPVQEHPGPKSVGRSVTHTSDSASCETGCVLSGEASRTARAVAGVRATAERVPAPYGDPAADDRLQQLVAGSTTGSPSAAMSRYLIARTRFFDAQVVAALDRGITQVLVVAAGYDGRALRYAKRGVRWLELDHPATQADKLDRLGPTGGATTHKKFLSPC